MKTARRESAALLRARAQRAEMERRAESADAWEREMRENARHFVEVTVYA